MAVKAVNSVAVAEPRLGPHYRPSSVGLLQRGQVLSGRQGGNLTGHPHLDRADVGHTVFARVPLRLLPLFFPAGSCFS